MEFAFDTGHKAWPYARCHAKIDLDFGSYLRREWHGRVIATYRWPGERHTLLCTCTLYLCHGRVCLRTTALCTDLGLRFFLRF